MTEASKPGDFKAGDRVRIIAEVGGHQYADGTVVTLTGQRDETGEGILAEERDDWGIRWYVLPEEIEHEGADPRIAEAERRGAVKALRWIGVPAEFIESYVSEIAQEDL